MFTLVREIKLGLFLKCWERYYPTSYSSLERENPWFMSSHQSRIVDLAVCYEWMIGLQNELVFPQEGLDLLSSHVDSTPNKIWMDWPRSYGLSHGGTATPKDTQIERAVHF